MSYTVTLGRGCEVYVSCHPRTNAAHTRVIERRGQACRVRVHDIGVRLQLWELLPEPAHDLDPSPVAPSYAVPGVPVRRSPDSEGRGRNVTFE